METHYNAYIRSGELGRMGEPKWRKGRRGEPEKKEEEHNKLTLLLTPSSSTKPQSST
jgi:hypothetical protein